MPQPVRRQSEYDLGGGAPAAALPGRIVGWTTSHVAGPPSVGWQPVVADGHVGARGTSTTPRSVPSSSTSRHGPSSSSARPERARTTPDPTAAARPSRHAGRPGLGRWSGGTRRRCRGTRRRCPKHRPASSPCPSATSSPIVQRAPWRSRCCVRRAGASPGPKRWGSRLIVPPVHRTRTTDSGRGARRPRTSVVRAGVSVGGPASSVRA